jgi:glycosyltransferase involved in cell wall biosynthesis
MSIQVSVVIPTYRRRDLLERVLTAVCDQTLPPDEYEVIVADDEASKQTQDLVADWNFRAAPEVRYVPVVATQGPAGARNAGWRIARGPIVAFTDDDTIPDRDWLRAGATAFVGDIASVTGRIVVPLPASPTDYERDTSRLEGSEFATANCLYRRDVLEAVGGFDERFTAAWREDSDLYLTLLDRGYALGRAVDAIVVHPVRPAHWGVSISQQRKAMFNALLYKKHPQLYRARVEQRPPWRSYGTVAALAGALGTGALRRRTAAVASAGVWLLLTARFCTFRLRGNSHDPIHVAEMAVTSSVIPLLSVVWRLRGAIKYRVAFL